GREPRRVDRSAKMVDGCPRERSSWRPFTAAQPSHGLGPSGTEGWTMLLGKRLRSVARPVIRTERELFVYVVRVTILCGLLAVCLDVVNQLTFFIDWETSIRSWVISAFIATGIAAPVAFAIARAHLDLYRAKLVVEELSRT